MKEKDHSMELETIDITFNNPTFTQAKIMINNYPISNLNIINEDFAEQLHSFQYYLFKLYDTIEIDGLRFLITKQSQKQINLLCTGITLSNVSGKSIMYTNG